MKKTPTLFAFLVLISLLFSFKSNSQCTWKTLLYDDFEYTGVCPYIVPGTTYGGSTATWTSHNGSRSAYMNLVNCVASTGAGTCYGDTFFYRPIGVCQGTNIKISTFVTTTFSGSQCDVRVLIVDKNNNVLDSTSSIVAAYSPVWTQYQSISFVPPTDTIFFIMTANNPGNPGGNDLSMDEFKVENCDNISFEIGNDTSICSTQGLTLDAGSGFSSYNWNTGSTAQSIVATTTQVGPVYQYYSVYVKNNGCVYGDSLWVLFKNCAAINSIDFNNQYAVFPNPASHEVTIRLNNLPVQGCYLVFCDDIGREVLRTEIKSLLQTIPLNGVKSGLYVYRIMSGGKMLSSGKTRLE